MRKSRLMYDAIVIGGSFAGLSVASRLSGRIAVVDKLPIGARQTSACATPTALVEAVGCGEAIASRSSRLVFHTQGRTVSTTIPAGYCTFDYERFCRLLAAQSRAEIVRATVVRVDEHDVVTDSGTLTGRCVIDCSGWTAVTSGRSMRDAARDNEMNFGYETEVPVESDGLQFWLDPDVVRSGVAWLFPCGDRSRAGVASYIGRRDLSDEFSRFLRHLGAESAGLHGNYFPTRLGSPTNGSVFRVGDAAGQCMALTGEGIRPAVAFGVLCGRLVQSVIDGDLTERQAMSRYAWVVRLRLPRFAGLRLAQTWIAGASGRSQRRLVTALAATPVSRPLLSIYMGLGPSFQPSRPHC